MCVCEADFGEDGTRQQVLQQPGGGGDRGEPGGTGIDRAGSCGTGRDRGGPGSTG